jgi:hypothetical protein
MRSIADDARDASRRRVLRLSAAERVQMTFSLGDADLALLCAARGIARQEAIAAVRRSRQHGRRRCSAAGEAGR